MTIVAFDVDGTLIDYDDMPRLDIIELLKLFHSIGCKTIVWSGSGKDYADRWVNRLDLYPYVDIITAKGVDIVPDIAIDDALVQLGTVNVCVGMGDHQERWQRK